MAATPTDSFPAASLAEPFISHLFLQILSGLHYFMMSERDVDRLAMSNTSSVLYNFSKALNMSQDPNDAYY